MDKRLEKIRTFKGNVLDFESFIKDKIEQTKKQYAKDKELEKKRINESMSTYKIWNDIEVEKFAKGTIAVAKSLAETEATTIIGGGDSAAAVTQLGYADKMSHISTGGGASLELFEGKKLPGIECLNNK